MCAGITVVILFSVLVERHPSVRFPIDRLASWPLQDKSAKMKPAVLGETYLKEGLSCQTYFDSISVYFCLPCSREGFLSVGRPWV